MIKVEKIVRIDSHPKVVRFTANKHFVYLEIGGETMAELTYDNVEDLLDGLSQLLDSIERTKAVYNG